MGIFLIRIESNSDWNIVQLSTVGSWIRAPGRPLKYSARDIQTYGTILEIDDTTIQFSQSAGSFGALALELHVDTPTGTIGLHTDKGGIGTLTITSATDRKVNNRMDGGHNPMDFTLFVDPNLAGGLGGDPALLQKSSIGKSGPL